MNPRLVNRRVAQLPPSGIRKFFDLVLQSRDVISLGVGEPDFATPWHVREQAIYGIERGRTNYTSNRGLPELRKEIAAYLEAWQGIRYDPESEVLVTVGVAEAIDLVMRAVLNPGDKVLVPEPCFVSYVPCAVLAGGEAVVMPTRADQQFKLTPELLRRHLTPEAKVLLMGFPNNPTGAVMTASDLEGIAALAVAHDLLVVSDEIYGRLTYGAEHRSIASLPGMKDRTILLNGLSKAYAMTGWRIGYACGPAEVVAAMTKIHQYTIMCAPIAGQLAALEALKRGAMERERMVAEYDRRRNLVLDGFERMGLSCFEPKGAFYAFPSIEKTGMTDEAFAMALLERAKVAVVPGSAFGQSGCGHVRVSYSASIETLREALKRMDTFLASL